MRRQNLTPQPLSLRRKGEPEGGSTLLCLPVEGVSSGSHALRGNRSSPALRVWGDTLETTSADSSIAYPPGSGQDAERRRRHSHAERGNEDAEDPTGECCRLWRQVSKRAGHLVGDWSGKNGPKRAECTSPQALLWQATTPNKMT